MGCLIGSIETIIESKVHNIKELLTQYRKTLFIVVLKTLILMILFNNSLMKIQVKELIFKQS